MHRFLENWLADLQLLIVWEELLSRVEVVGEPVPIHSNISRYTSLPAQFHRSRLPHMSGDAGCKTGPRAPFAPRAAWETTLEHEHHIRKRIIVGGAAAALQVFDPSHSQEK